MTISLGRNNKNNNRKKVKINIKLQKPKNKSTSKSYVSYVKNLNVVFFARVIVKEPFMNNVEKKYNRNKPCSQNTCVSDHECREYCH